MSSARHAGPSGGGDAAGACPLCAQAGGLPVWTSAWMRLIRADEPLHPATWRLVWNAHVAEFGDLPRLQRLACMDALVLVERELREALRPRKINLAALGNLVPHLHWHVIARWDWDAHWPAPVWAPAAREPDAARLLALREGLPALDARLRDALEQRFGTEIDRPQITRE